MKKQILTLLLISLSFMYFGLLSAFAQQKKENDENLPPSFRYKLKKEVPEIFFDYPDKGQHGIDSLRKTRYPMVGVHEIKQEINFMKKAVCEKLPNGDKVYRLKFNCDARLDDIYFKELQIPKGATIYTVFPNKNDFSILNINRKNIGARQTSYITIEYIQPQKIKQKPKIIIQNLTLSYVENNTPKGSVDEQDLVCNPLIRCSLAEYNVPGFPVTDDIKDLLATSVMKIRIYKPLVGCSTVPQDSWECTGTFINSTDKRLFILTANHNLKGCYEAGSIDNQVKLRITFNYEDVDCEEGGDFIFNQYPDVSGINSAIDAFLVARNPDSDMALLEIAGIT